MSTKYLGDEFDIHGGGLDLIFPHHECELAQARGAGKPFARFWMHWNMLTLGGEKMAKSKGHVVALDELFREFDSLAVRFHLLRSHYRSVSDFSEESLSGSTQGLRRLQDLYRLLLEHGDRAAVTEGDPMAEFRSRFADAMNDDLNTPQAVATLFDAAREINRRIEEGAPDAYIGAARSMFDELFGEVLGMAPAPSAVRDADPGVLSGVLELLLEQRHEARLRRDFSAADRIRARLGELGVVVEDSSDGSRWKLA